VRVVVFVVLLSSPPRSSLSFCPLSVSTVTHAEEKCRRKTNARCDACVKSVGICRLPSAALQPTLTRCSHYSNHAAASFSNLFHRPVGVQLERPVSNPSLHSA
jgi:hypothetical protein